MPKQKKVVKSKDELLKQLRGNQDFMKKIKFIKETFYPVLVTASKNIEDATSFLSSINTIIMQDFLSRMKDIKMSDMKLVDKLDTKDEKYEELKALLAIFDDMDVFTAKEYIEGMRQEISLFLSDEQRERPLSSLKTKWVDEL